MKEFAESFYKSMAWKNCRASYISSKRGLCERCLDKGLFSPGVIVHHKIKLTPQNITDPSITLGWDNLQLLCRDCHAQVHGREKRYTIDEAGRVITPVSQVTA